MHQPRVPDEALAAGWYLHGVASSPAAFDLYTPARQRRAFQVSAHILDLAMQDRGRSRLDRCRLAFGAAVGYRRGELEPNAMAVYRRARTILESVEDALLDRLPFVPFEVGLTVLGFETRALADLTTAFRLQFGELRRQVDLVDLGQPSLARSSSSLKRPSAYSEFAHSRDYPLAAVAASVPVAAATVFATGAYRALDHGFESIHVFSGIGPQMDPAREGALWPRTHETASNTAVS